MNHFTCFIFGNTTLPIQSARKLLLAGHTILGMVTTDSEVANWAAENEIPHYSPKDDLLAILRAKPYDYLFSIINNLILSAEILATPTAYAINYHDGPLPRYAGTYATAWAIINGEKTHGITWHKMVEQVDAGDILKQAFFPLEADETSLSINAKAYTAAIDSFAQLIDEMANDQINPQVQDMSQRTFFGRFLRPPAGGLIDWTQPAESISALMRGLSFGPYENPLTLPKFRLDGQVLALIEAEQTDIPSSQPPASLIETELGQIAVATASNNLILKRVTDLFGNEIPLSNLSLTPGLRLESPSAEEAERLTALNRRAAENETFWRRRLAKLQPLEWPYPLQNSNEGANFKSLVISLPQNHPPRFLLTAFISFLARLSDTFSFDIGFSHSELLEGQKNIFAPFPPLSIALDENAPFAEAQAHISAQIERVQTRFTYALDTITRYPALKGQSALHCPLALALIENLAELEPAPDALLTVGISASGEMRCYYNASIVNGADVAGMAKHFVTFLLALSQKSETPLTQLPLLMPAEQHQLTVLWNETDSDYPRRATIERLFEAQVAQTPHAVALVFPSEGLDGSHDEILTYAQLNRRANKLAHFLRGRGLGPDTPVALAVERSVNMMVAVLAILKAGGAYVPLDTAFPPERLAFVLSDTRAELLLTDQATAPLLPPFEGDIISLDALEAELASQPTENPTSSHTAHHLAYIMYTSGSTGQPKGVCIEHRSVVRLVKETNFAQLNADEVFLQLAPLAFDASTLEIWGSLLNGGLLVLYPFAKPALETLGRVLQMYNVTTLWLTAGLFHLMVDSHLDALGGLHQLLAGGDVLSPTHVKKVLNRFAEIKLINGYGPTENTTFTCCYPMRPGVEIGDSVPIGRPIANTQVYILDRFLQPVPVGISGQLYAGGDGLAREYLNRPDLTAEKFIVLPPLNSPRRGENLFVSPPLGGIKGGQRLYKTGDLARYRADGVIEFLGRADFQVKIRGFRIELGEIEAMLAQHPHIGQVVVSVWQETPADKRLVAYFVPQGEVPSTTDLRQFLSQSLPDYMIPFAFVPLNHFPLTPNGKVNRRALPQPQAERPNLRTPYAEATNSLEEKLLALWQELLGWPQIGIDDNFFELGGDSLLATQLVNRVQSLLGQTVPLQTIFTAGSIRALAQSLPGAEKLSAPVEANFPLADRNAPLPLSFPQQRLWFLDQFADGIIAYNIPVAYQLTGALDVSALQSALNTLIARHESLRTIFQAEEGVAAQVILPPQSLPIQIIDLQHLHPTQREESALQQGLTLASQPFNLSAGPLLRVALYQTEPQEYILVLVMHHIISDGWSMTIFLEEWLALYAGKDLPPLAVQYADFSAWQRQQMERGALAEQQNYWQKQLVGIPALLDFPTDYIRPPMQSYCGAVHSLSLPADLSQALKRFSQKEQATLFMSLLAAFQVLLYRYSGQSDVPVGTPIANRTRPQFEDLIGFFVNTLVLRGQILPEQSFADFLQQVKETALSAYEHQDLPFEALVEAIRPNRSLSHSPLFQMMFALQNTPLPKAEGDFSLSSLPLHNHSAKFDIFLEMLETPTGLHCNWEYNSDLFAPETIARLAEHFKILLTGIVANPKQAINRLPLLAPAEMGQMLLNWNSQTAPQLSAQSIHQLFEAQTAKTPSAPALIFGNERLSYQSLNERANQVAHYLQNLGVGPETLVAICTHRSVEMVVGILGILKAGGAYVPLDPAYPPGRIAFSLKDAQTAVLLTQQDLVAQLPQTEAKIVCLDSDWPVIAQQAVTNPVSNVKADNLAYVIYTSGSTGRPKGVAIEHRNAVALFAWAVTVFSADDLSGVLASTSICFDLSVFELFLPLSVGGTVVLVENILHLPDLQSPVPVSLLNTVPSAMTELVRLNAMPASVRVVNLAGEPLKNELAQSVYRQKNVERVYNLYGPSEDTTYSTCSLIARESETEPTIGRPIANTRAYILNSALQPVPIGVVGELYLGGDGVARGYLNRPALTAERFVENVAIENDLPSLNPSLKGRETTAIKGRETTAISSKREGDKSVAPPAGREAVSLSGSKGGRLYKTGDLARYLPNGEIEFLGRIDHQVKIRGFRIELGEVEAVLLQHSAVRGAVLMAREDIPGHKQLVAYVEANKSADLTGQLRSHLQQKLPDYMIPATFVLLGALPLTPNGKVDRRALPTPQAILNTQSEDYAPPQTAVQKLLTNIWGQVLGLERVGIHDNFFELGGDSILSIQIVAKANLLGLGLSSRQLFQNQTIAELALVTEELETLEAVQEPVTGPVPLTPIQHWFFKQNIAQTHYWNQSMLLELQRPLDDELLSQTVYHLLSQHDALRLRFTATDKGWLQHNAGLGEEAPFKRVSLSALKPLALPVALQETLEQLEQSLNLADGPVFRVAHINLGPHKPAYLFMVIHHLAVDGVSWRILLEDFHAIYRQLEAGYPPVLLPKTLSYKSWAETLVRYAQKDDLRQELRYWLDVVQKQSHSLPRDIAGQPDDNTVAYMGTVTVSLSEAETETLLYTLPSLFNTKINDPLLMALADTFGRWTGEAGVMINLEGHGREEVLDMVDLGRTVGWFTTIFPVYLPYLPKSSPIEALLAVSEQLRQTPNRGIGYGVLRYLSDDDSVRAQLALKPEVAFNYLGQFDQLLTANTLFEAVDGLRAKRSPQGARSHIISIDGYVSRRQLHLTWNYSHKLHRFQTIEGLAQGFISALQRLIAYSQAVERESANLLEMYPAGAMQAMMLEHYGKQAGVYHAQQVFSFEDEALSLTDFSTALQMVVARYPALRTSFIRHGSHYTQQVWTAPAVQISQLDISHLSLNEQSVHITDLLAQDRDNLFAPFQAEQSLSRFYLLKQSDTRFSFVFSAHHAIIDGWSAAQIVGEILACYKAQKRGQTVLPKPVSPVFKEFIALEQASIHSAEASVFWKAMLAKAKYQPLPQMGDISAQTIVPDPHLLHIPSKLGQDLITLSQQLKVSLQAVFLSAYLHTLNHYTEHSPITVGVVSNGRSEQLSEPLNGVGLFWYLVPFCQPNDAADNTLHIQAVQKVLLDLNPYVSYPLNNILHDQQTSALFEATFNYVHFHNTQVSDSGLKLVSQIERDHFHFPLNITVIVNPLSKQISLKATFDGHYFTDNQIDGLLAQYVEILGEYS